MKFLTPINSNYKSDYISQKITLKTVKDDYQTMMAIDNIQKDDILLIEYPKINLFGDEEIDKGLQMTKKYIEYKENELFPRNINDFPRTSIIKNVHKMIKNAEFPLGKGLNDVVYTIYSNTLTDRVYAGGDFVTDGFGVTVNNISY